MLRLTMIMLCLLLAAAAAGRYQAEVEVRETRREIRELDRLQAKEERQVQVLRAEIAYLESPDRLARIAARTTDLKPLSAAQLMTADDFALAFGDRARAQELAPPTLDSGVVRQALAMTDVALAE